MSVNVSFKMFALDKIHAAIMSPFCAKYDEEADEKQFMGKVSAGDWLSLIHFLWLMNKYYMVTAGWANSWIKRNVSQ